MKETKIKGNITEMSVMLAFIKLGYSISIPYGDSDRYDFIADIQNHLCRIQVKTPDLKCLPEKIIIPCCSTNYLQGKNYNQTYTKKDVDFLATFYDNQCYLIPVEQTPNKSMSLRFLSTKQNQTRGVHWAEDYKLEEVLKTYFG